MIRLCPSRIGDRLYKAMFPFEVAKPSRVTVLLQKGQSRFIISNNVFRPWVPKATLLSGQGSPCKGIQNCNAGVPGLK